MTQTLLQSQPNSLSWAVDELNNELNVVLRILENYSENQNREGKESLDECLQHLKQVTGIFAVANMAIPQLLGEELQTAITDYANLTGQAATDTISLVAEAILELSSYLGNPKRIKRLIPQINNLRALTERELFTESTAVEIDLDKGFRAFKKSSTQPLDSQTIRKLRMLYQKTVLSLFKSGLSTETLGNLQKVFKILYQMGGTPYLSALGYSGLTLIERLQTNNLTLNVAVKSLFKRLDDVLKKLNAGTEYEDLGLLKNILYYVACGTDHGELSSRLIDIFSLEEFADDAGTTVQGKSLSMEPELVAKVVEVLQTEIEQAKTWLDDCLHQACDFKEALRQVRAILRRADDTLIMVGADTPRQLAQNLLAILGEWEKLGSEKDLSPEDLDRFANEMVSLESQLARLSHPSANDADESTGVSGAKTTIIEESRVALTQIKTSISQFIESNWQWSMLREVPSSLAMIEGALRFYPLDDLAKVVNCIRRYVSESLLEKQEEPNQQEIDQLADVIVAVDYYLECLERGTAFNLEFLIERAFENCTALGYSYKEPAEAEASQDTREAADTHVEDVDEDSTVFGDTNQFKAEELSPSDETTETPESGQDEVPSEDEEPEPAVTEPSTEEPAAQEPANDEDDDFEIIEIFVEEAGEILPIAHEQLKEWRENEDKAALLDLRRGFHTLKGGGRMIGASVLGELSWAMENLLNRIIDNSVEVTPEIHALTQEALNQYPALLEELSASGTESSNDDIERIGERAHVLADPLANVSAGKEADEPATPDTEEPIAEQIAPEHSDPEEATTEIEAEAETPATVQENEPEASPDSESPDGEVEEDDSGAGFDEVVTTFVNEAEDHRKSIIQLTAAASTNKNEQSAAQLVTILHTLADSARVAELDELADSIAPLQKLLQLYNSFNSGLSSEFIALLSIWAGRFDTLLNHLIQSGNLDLKPVQDVAKSASELYTREEKALTSTGDLSSDRKKRFLPLHRLMAEHLDYLIRAEQLIHEWSQGEISSEDLDGLDADLKSLAEVASACQVDEIIRLCKYIEEVQTSLTGQATLEESQAQWLDQAYGLLLKMLDAVASWQVVPKVSNDLISTLPKIESGEKETGESTEQEITEEAPDSEEAESPSIELEPDAPLGEDLQFDSNFIDPEDEFQQELLDTFLEEADDLMQEIDTSISAWRRDPTAFDNADLIHRALHTLKGGARLSGLTKLGDFSHDFESFIIDQQVLQKADEDFFAKALERLDLLNSHIEAIREVMLSGGSLEDVPAPDKGKPGSNEEAEPSDEPEMQVIPAEELAPSESEPVARDQEKINEQIQEAVAESEPGADSDSRAFEARQHRQENIRLRSDLVDEMINLSSEATVYRGRVEAQLAGLENNLDELEATIGRIQQLARRLDTETEAQIQFRSEQLAESGEEEDFDPLEMDRYSTLQQLSHQLIESASDLQDLRASLSETNRDTNVLLVQSGRIQSELNAQLMRTRMVPFERLLPRLERIVRTVSRELNKKAEIRALDISGEMDRTVLEQLVPPIEHILRNSIDHGIENAEGRSRAHKPPIGRITFNLHREGSYMVLTITDDGAGIDFEAVRRRAVDRGLIGEAESTALSREEVAEFLFMPGFSTAQAVTQISGRGVGMDVVKSTIREMGGSINLSSELGKGTRFQLSIPFTTSVNRALMVHCGEDLYALPLASLEALVRLSRTDLQSYYENPNKKLAYGADEYDFGYLGELLKTRERPPMDAIIEPTVSVVLFRVGNHRLALLIDEIVGSNEVVVKSLSYPFNAVPGLSGAAIMGDGSVVVTLDMPALIASHYTSVIDDTDQGNLIQPYEETHTPTIMVVDDSVTVRKVTSRFLTREGFIVETARDGAEALRMVHDHAPDLMLVDVEMPRMDGFELLGTLRSSEKFENLPIVLITSRTGEKHKQRGLSLGANNYFGKPYREDQLLEEIKRLLAEVKNGR